MNIDFAIEKLVPRFLMADRNGYALAKAIEKAFQLAAAAAQDGIDQIQDPAKMTEARLDEMAREYNIPYDFTAPIEVKRRWIQEAYELSRNYGTKDGMSKYLKGYFEDAQVVEAEEYSGSPFHFRVNLDGTWNASKHAWVLRAIAQTKNVRSVLDGILVELPDIDADHQVYVGAAIYGVETHTMESEEPVYDPDEFLVDETGAYLVDENWVGLSG